MCVCVCGEFENIFGLMENRTCLDHSSFDTKCVHIDYFFIKEEENSKKCIKCSPMLHMPSSNSFCSISPSYSLSFSSCFSHHFLRSILVYPLFFLFSFFPSFHLLFLFSISLILCFFLIFFLHHYHSSNSPCSSILVLVLFHFLHNSLHFPLTLFISLSVFSDSSLCFIITDNYSTKGTNSTYLFDIIK